MAVQSRRRTSASGRDLPVDRCALVLHFPGHAEAFTPCQYPFLSVFNKFRSTVDFAEIDKKHVFLTNCLEKDNIFRPKHDTAGLIP